MKNYKSRLMICSALFLLLLSCANASSLDSLELFSETDAQQLQYTDEEWDDIGSALGSAAFKTRSSSTYGFGSTEPNCSQNEDGPVIEVIKPLVQDYTITTNTPTALKIEFLDGKYPVNMASLKVVGKKGMFTRDITRKLEPYIQENRIISNNLNLPKGKYVLDVSLADSKGITTCERYRLAVR